MQLLAALAQTVMIILDRFAYLYRSIGLKALLHFSSAIFIHIAVFFVLPLRLGTWSLVEWCWWCERRACS
jgi:hypothetical protein